MTGLFDFRLLVVPLFSQVRGFLVTLLVYSSGRIQGGASTGRMVRFTFSQSRRSYGHPPFLPKPERS